MGKKYVWPLPQPLQISCSFACHKARKPPSMLPGTDYPKKVGTKVHAITGGRVITADRIDNSASGKYVTVQHGKGFYSQYLHLSTVNVKAGDQVNAGDVLGSVGSTGASTGPHLHLAVRYFGVLVDPHKFLSRRVK